MSESPHRYKEFFFIDKPLYNEGDLLMCEVVDDVGNSYRYSTEDHGKIVEINRSYDDLDQDAPWEMRVRSHHHQPLK